jgi:hypothetical protein
VGVISTQRTEDLMIKARGASVLVIGGMAAVAIGSGVALASGDDHAGTPSRAAVAATPTDSPSPSASADDRGFDSGLGQPRSAPASSPASASAPASGDGPAVGVVEARTIALRAAGGGRVTKVERETEHRRAVWEVEVITGGVEHDIDVDRATGAVLRHKTDRDDDRGRGGDDDRGPDPDDRGRDDD